MNFTTGNADINGTHLQGEFVSTRREIEAVFGKPNFEDGCGYDKVTTEWDITFSDGTVATIYDWKRYEMGAPTMDEYENWHIGGKVGRAVDLVLAALKAKASV